MATNSNPNPPNGNTGQSQGQSTGTIPNNLGPAQILQLIATNPELLTDSERVLPDQAKIQIIHNKIVKLVQQQKMKAQAQGPGNNGNAGGNANTNGGGNANAQLNVNGNGNGNNGQASTPAPSGPSNANTPGSGPGSAGPPPKRPPGRPSNQQVAAARAAAAAMQATQSQNMMQQQQQQQQQNQSLPQPQQQPPSQQQHQHFQAVLERTQRLQQQNLQQHQQQQIQQQMAAMQGQHPTPSQQHAQLPPPPPPQGNMTAPSPQQPAQSPMVHHSSPAGPMRSNSIGGMPVPPPPQSKPLPNMQTIIDNFPSLYRRKHAGQLQPEQENLFDQFLNTEPGRQALQRFQSQEASIVIQNNLNNPISQPHQMPPMTQAQLQMAAQQQLAPLQQQQQQQQQAAAVAHAQAAQLAAQQQQFQNLVQNGGHQRIDQQQFQQQMQLRQLAQANINRAQGAANLVQANALARAQVQAQAQMHAQQQMNDPNMQAQMNFGSPRPPQAMPQGQMRPNMPPPNPQMQSTIARLSAMPEAQREKIFNQKPEIRNVYYQHLAQMQAAGTPNIQARPAANFPIANNVPANLHIPAGKQRNNSSGGAQQQAGQSPQMRPPAQILPQGAAPNQNPSTSAQLATLQRMINQGIPVQGNGQQFPRPPINPAMYAAAQQSMQQAQGQGQTRQTPEQFMNHQQQQGGVPGSERPLAPQVMRNNTASGASAIQGGSNDSANGLLSRTSWVPTPEYDAKLIASMSEFRPSIRSSLRGNRILGDVVLERMPDALRALADEVDQDGDGDKGLENVSGLPGQKKRKVQELAESVDRGLVIDGDVEKLILNLADEHVDLIGQFACGLAKHRKSDTIDRKDIQLSYETLFGRLYPAFSSDSIRLDQAKSGRRTQPASTSVRASRMKAVNDHKALLKREKENKAAAVITAAKVVEDDPGRDGEKGGETMDQSGMADVPVAPPPAAPTAVAA